MGWTGGQLQRPFTSLAAIEFDSALSSQHGLSTPCATAASSTPPCARAMAKTSGGWCCSPSAATGCSTRSRSARTWDQPRTAARPASSTSSPSRVTPTLTNGASAVALVSRRVDPRKGQTIAFAKPIAFTNGESHSSFTYNGGSRFRAANGCECHIRCWQELRVHRRVATARR